VYVPPFGAEVVTVFTPSPPASVTMDKDITTKTVKFSTPGTWTFKVKDHSGNTATVVVQ
jgi:hypothetical protein